MTEFTFPLVDVALPEETVPGGSCPIRAVGETSVWLVEAVERAKDEESADD